MRIQADEASWLALGEAWADEGLKVSLHAPMPELLVREADVFSDRAGSEVPTMSWRVSRDPVPAFEWQLDTGLSVREGQSPLPLETALKRAVRECSSLLLDRPVVQAAGGVVIVRTPLVAGVVLVTERAAALDRRLPSLRWRLPKGIVEPGETVAEAARREVLEETGLDVELLVGVGDAEWAYLYDSQEFVKRVTFFLCSATSRSAESLSDEVVTGFAVVAVSIAVDLLEFSSEQRVLRRALELHQASALLRPPP